MDGTLAASRTNNGTIWNSTNPMRSIGAFMQIATDPDPWHPSFLGYLDWVRVSDDARYTGNSYAVPPEPTPDSDTLLLYTFDNLAPGSTIVPDLSSNHYDGTLVPGLLRRSESANLGLSSS